MNLHRVLRSHFGGTTSPFLLRNLDFRPIFIHPRPFASKRNCSFSPWLLVRDDNQRRGGERRCGMVRRRTADPPQNPPGRKKRASPTSAKSAAGFRPQHTRLPLLFRASIHSRWGACGGDPWFGMTSFREREIGRGRRESRRFFGRRRLRALIRLGRSLREILSAFPSARNAIVRLPFRSGLP